MIIEESENLVGHRMMTVRSDRGDEYVIDADAAVEALAQLFSDQRNERRFGWTLERPWFEQALSKLKTAALVSLQHHGEVGK